MNDWIGSDSLAFISLDGLRASLADAGRDEASARLASPATARCPLPTMWQRELSCHAKDFEAVYAGEVS
ncbi:MAG: hypothetical protein ACLTDR_14495 [Adlercreutzia equolifaciens]